MRYSFQSYLFRLILAVWSLPALALAQGATGGVPPPPVPISPSVPMTIGPPGNAGSQGGTSESQSPQLAVPAPSATGKPPVTDSPTPTVAVGCVEKIPEQYILVQTSGALSQLSGKLDGLVDGSVVELHGKWSRVEPADTTGLAATQSAAQIFIVNSSSVLSTSCAIASWREAERLPVQLAFFGRAFERKLLAYGVGSQGGTVEMAGVGSQGGTAERSGSGVSDNGGLKNQAGAPRLLTQKSEAPPKVAIPNFTHLQVALSAMKYAEDELVQAGPEKGSQTGLALQTVRTAIGNLELAIKTGEAAGR